MRGSGDIKKPIGMFCDLLRAQQHGACMGIDAHAENSMRIETAHIAGGVVKAHQRMDFRDKDGAPLIKWHEPEEAFEHFKQLTKGRPCDYSGMTYAKLSAGSGIQWPCNEKYPEGKERLYDDGRFSTAADYCEIYGHDLMTGAPVDAVEYHAKNPNGKAKIKAADYQPPPEEPDESYPLWLTTGRLVYHFHTRTKTGRAEALNDAAPDVYVQISSCDAERYEIAEGDLLRVESRRGSVEAPARVSDIAGGHLFIPFHYGYWDEDGENDSRGRAANELTITAWDPVSKQPYFKFAAVRIKKVAWGCGTRISVRSNRLTAKSSAGEGNPARTRASGMDSTSGTAASGWGAELMQILFMYPVYPVGRL